MADTKSTKGRKRKEPLRAANDALQSMAATPTNGADRSDLVTNGRFTTSREHGTHAMSGDHRINGHIIRGQHAVGAADDERRRMIAEAAYFRAMRRGFANGSPETDWLEAEAEIVALLANAGMRA